LFLIAEGQPALFSTLAWPSAVWQAAANKQVAAEAVTPTCFWPPEPAPIGLALPESVVVFRGRIPR